MLQKEKRRQRERENELEKFKGEGSEWQKEPGDREAGAGEKIPKERDRWRETVTGEERDPRTERQR